MPGSARVPRLAAAIGLAGILAAACAPASGIPEDVRIQDQPEGYLVSVVDSLQDAGRSPSVALDGEGNPAVAYLMYVPVLKQGDIQPGVIATQPQPPAVMLATQTGGIWSRVSVTPQSTNPLTGEAPEIADPEGHAIPGVSTGLAVDGQGTHHVVWSTPSGLIYSSDAGGGFAAPEKIVSTPVYGGSIAVGSNGDPWVSFYGSNVIRVAHRTGDSWAVEDVDTITVPPDVTGLNTVIRFGSGGETVVAFGDSGVTKLATNSGSGWSTQAIPGSGGFGISLALQGGNARLAYYDGAGAVFRAASEGGGSWQAEQVAEVGPPAAPSPSPGGPAEPAPPSDPRWGTGIGLSEGVDYLAYADTNEGSVVLLSNQGGSFAKQPLEGAENGATPSIALTADGSKVVVSWFDTINADLAVAEPTEGPLVIAHSPAPPPTVSPGGGPTASPGCEPSGTQLAVSAQNIQFDTNCLAAPAGEAFTIEFTNNDAGVPHNVAILESAGGARLGAATGITDTIIGPASTTYQVEPLEEGVYYFLCDVHPNMNGQFVVA